MFDKGFSSQDQCADMQWIRRASLADIKKELQRVTKRLLHLIFCLHQLRDSWQKTKSRNKSSFFNNQSGRPIWSLSVLRALCLRCRYGAHCRSESLEIELVMDHSLICSHCSLIRLLRTTRFAVLAPSAVLIRSLARSLTCSRLRGSVENVFPFHKVF